MKIFMIALICFAFIGNSCNNSDKKGTNEEKSTTESSKADSLMEQVMNGHNEGMSGESKLKRMEATIQRMIDSIGKLPAKTRKALGSLSTKLDTALSNVRSARSGMDKWMEEFNMDSAKNDMGVRIQYLTSEKDKIEKVKTSIVNGLQKADSLIKARF